MQQSDFISVKNLYKTYGDVCVLKNLSFEIREGEFLCFLGPSGCGKTTLLFCLAGLEQPTSGNITKRGGPFLTKPPSERDVGIVFQSYALFPNLTVIENIRFGLENQKKSKSDIRKISGELVELLSLSGHERKYPGQLSGGQQQRVALARAIAVSPSLLLLDEPLSALDAQVRARLRGELRDLQSRLGITTIMVTHDQEEAQSLADRIVLMDHGVIEQIGSPWEIYNKPQSKFVADFIGVSNLFDAELVHPGLCRTAHFDLPIKTTTFLAGDRFTVLLRPEDIEVYREPQASCFTSGVVEKVEFLGPLVRLHIRLGSGPKIVVDRPQKFLQSGPVKLCTSVWLSTESGDVKALPPKLVDSQ